MSDPQTNELTPEARAILKRARFSFLFSIGLLVIGLAIIGGILALRSGNSSGSAAGADYALASLKIPNGAEVLSAVAADGKVTVTYTAGTLTSVRVFDGKSGEMIREIPVVSE